MSVDNDMCGSVDELTACTVQLFMDTLVSEANATLMTYSWSSLQ